MKKIWGLLLLFLLSINCSDTIDNPTDNTHSGKLTGKLEYFFASVSGIDYSGPLDEATIIIDNKTFQANDSGYFNLSGLTPGKLNLRIIHKKVGVIDTIVTVPDNNLNLIFRVTPLKGSVYRLLRSWEENENESQKKLLPIAATILIDDLFQVQIKTDHECNIKNDSDLFLAYGKHKFVVTSPDMYTLDTTLIINSLLVCQGTTDPFNNPLNLIVSPIPFRQFDYPLAIGASWTYKYTYDYFHQGETKKINGIHYWTIQDSVIEGKVVHFKIQTINKDTVFYKTGNPSDSGQTTYQNDTSFFYIDRISPVLIVKSPFTHYSTGDTLQGFFNGSDIVTFGSSPIFEDKQVVYKEGTGLVSYKSSNNTNTVYRTIFELIEKR